MPLDIRPFRLNRLSLLALGALALSGSMAAAQDQPLGSATTPDSKVRIDVISLKRTEGDTLTMRFRVTNDSNDRFILTLGNIRLVDMVGRRLYSPGLTSPTCNVEISETQPCYAVYQAPPVATQKISVQFYDKIDLITDVPISGQ